MALFVDLDEEGETPQSSYQPYNHHQHYGTKPGWHAQKTHSVDDLVVITTPPQTPTEPQGHFDAGMRRKDSLATTAASVADAALDDDGNARFDASEITAKNMMAEALRCYPVVMSIGSELDLNTLDDLSRTCRRVREALLPYRSSLVTHTLHCMNEDLPVDPEDTFRFRARAGNWFYMEDISRVARTGSPIGGRNNNNSAGARTAAAATTSEYSGKSGSCARDMVGGCRRCGNVVCRNCAIKPPAPAVLRHRHRRLCQPCTKAPLPTLVKPCLLPGTSLEAPEMQRSICTCVSQGVWLCQPCGRCILGADHDYQSIWKWRNQYGEVLGGVGTGIGEGDRGVICGRESSCCSAREREQEIDCDAEDARELDLERERENGGIVRTTATTTTIVSNFPAAHTPFSSSSSSSSSGSSTSSSNQSSAAALRERERADATRTPSPQLRPGYARHEIEGIGGVVKTKLVRIVRVGACVPEWEDEKSRGQVLGREVSGRSRSLCGWCWRVIPGKKDRGDEDGGPGGGGDGGS